MICLCFASFEYCSFIDNKNVVCFTKSLVQFSCWLQAIEFCLQMYVIILFKILFMVSLRGFLSVPLKCQTQWLNFTNHRWKWKEQLRRKAYQCKIYIYIVWNSVGRKVFLWDPQSRNIHTPHDFQVSMSQRKIFVDYLIVFISVSLSWMVFVGDFANETPTTMTMTMTETDAPFSFALPMLRLVASLANNTHLHT